MHPHIINCFAQFPCQCYTDKQTATSKQFPIGPQAEGYQPCQLSIVHCQLSIALVVPRLKQSLGQNRIPIFPQSQKQR
jgi:hypothetical protein